MILSGGIDANAEIQNDQDLYQRSFHLGRGDVVGYGSIISNNRSVFTIHVTEATTLGMILRASSINWSTPGPNWSSWRVRIWGRH